MTLPMIRKKDCHLNLDKSVAIVMGASGAIGSATVRALAAAGATVVLAAPAAETDLLDKLCAEAQRAGAPALVVPTDVTIRAEIDRLVKTTLATFETVDILVNAAGVGSSAALCDDNDNDLQRVIEVNLLGCARTIHAVLPVMRMQGSGSIINIGSVAGEAAIMGIYSASKFGLRGLTDSVRRETRSSNIGVTLIEPGFLRSKMNASMGNGLPSPDIVARAVVRSVLRPRRSVIVPRYYAGLACFAKLFPGLIDCIFGDPRVQQRLNRDTRAQKTPSTGSE
jgi:NAD(P)-dependent dehydrogenase (short-subunit alcohol dehydrogenase family)